MPAYIISRIKVTDEERFAQYRDASMPIAEKYGAEYLARSDEIEVLDGQDDGRRIVIIAFPDMAQLQAFWNSDDYQATRELRIGAAEIDIVALPGLA